MRIHHRILAAIAFLAIASCLAYANAWAAIVLPDFHTLATYNLARPLTCDFFDRPVEFGHTAQRCWLHQGGGYRILVNVQNYDETTLCVRGYNYFGVPGDDNDLPTLYSVLDANHNDILDCVE
ncbi:MAG TPA: hypothetical protein VHI13_21810 [Candidatus Kapabacteria bacterium]|nr:hypothetical protein [Candidatus Kapabacteria bacterium]